MTEEVNLAVGDTVFQTDGVRIYKLKIHRISLFNGFVYYETDGIDFDERAVGISIFTSEDEAMMKRGKE